MDTSTMNHQRAMVLRGRDHGDDDNVTRSPPPQPPQQQWGVMTAPGFHGSRPLPPQPLSINQSAGPNHPSSLHSASLSTSSSYFSSADSTFSSSPPSPTLTLPSPTSSVASSSLTTYIHKPAEPRNLLTDRRYMSPASPVGVGFLDPGTTRGPQKRGVIRCTGGGVPGGSVLAMRLSGDAELTMSVRGNVDMIVVAPGKSGFKYSKYHG